MTNTSIFNNMLKESTSYDTTLAETDELFDDWDGETNDTKRLCSGHERAIPIDNLVMDLDVKEEGMIALIFRSKH